MCTRTATLCGLDSLLSLWGSPLRIAGTTEFDFRVAIGTGTGKTVLAIENAVRLAPTVRHACRTCISAPLAAMLRGDRRQLDGLSGPVPRGGAGESAGLVAGSAADHRCDGMPAVDPGHAARRC
jgi:hypothetical protein